MEQECEDGSRRASNKRTEQIEGILETLRGLGL
jgi:hypothetical protein